MSLTFSALTKPGEEAQVPKFSLGSSLKSATETEDSRVKSGLCRGHCSLAHHGVKLLDLSHSHPELLGKFGLKLGPSPPLVLLPTPILRQCPGSGALYPVHGAFPESPSERVLVFTLESR